MPTDTPPPELLDLDPDEFLRRGDDVLRWIARYLGSTRDYPVLSRSQPGELSGRLAASGPEQARPWEEILRDIDELIMPAMTHWNHPRFFAYFANTGSAPGILGAALATALNPNGMLWRTSPAATELEARVTHWLAEWLGLGDMPFGIINDTASTSSLVALAAARQAVPAYDRQVGMRSVGPLRVYASDQAHSSIDKAAVILGLGLDAVRRVATLPDYSLDPEALADAIAEDRDHGMLRTATTGSRRCAWSRPPVRRRRPASIPLPQSQPWRGPRVCGCMSMPRTAAPPRWCRKSASCSPVGNRPTRLS